MHGILRPLAPKARELVRKVTSFFRCGSRVSVDPKFREKRPAKLEEELAIERALRHTAEEDLRATLNELRVTRQDLRKWQNNYLNLAEGFSWRTQSSGKYLL